MNAGREESARGLEGMRQRQPAAQVGALGRDGEQVADQEPPAVAPLVLEVLRQLLLEHAANRGARRQPSDAVVEILLRGGGDVFDHRGGDRVAGALVHELDLSLLTFANVVARDGPLHDAVAGRDRQRERFLVGSESDPGDDHDLRVVLGALGVGTEALFPLRQLVVAMQHVAEAHERASDEFTADSLGLHALEVDVGVVGTALELVDERGQEVPEAARLVLLLVELLFGLEQLVRATHFHARRVELTEGEIAHRQLRVEQDALVAFADVVAEALGDREGDERLAEVLGRSERLVLDLARLLRGVAEVSQAALPVAGREGRGPRFGAGQEARAGRLLIGVQGLRLFEVPALEGSEGGFGLGPVGRATRSQSEAQKRGGHAGGREARQSVGCSGHAGKAHHGPAPEARAQATYEGVLGRSRQIRGQGS